MTYERRAQIMKLLESRCQNLISMDGEKNCGAMHIYDLWKNANSDKMQLLGDRKR
jgi:hypothetical protein